MIVWGTTPFSKPRKITMKNITTGLALALSTIGLSSTAEAKTVLDASARCFLIGLEEPGGWQQTIKINPKKP